MKEQDRLGAVPIRYMVGIKQLDEWLGNRNARLLWSSDKKGVGRVRGWNVRGRTVIVIVFENERGFDMFVSPDENGITATFAAVDRMLGVEVPS